MITDVRSGDARQRIYELRQTLEQAWTVYILAEMGRSMLRPYKGNSGGARATKAAASRRTPKSSLHKFGAVVKFEN